MNRFVIHLLYERIKGLEFLQNVQTCFIQVIKLAFFDHCLQPCDHVFHIVILVINDFKNITHKFVTLRFFN